MKLLTYPNSVAGGQRLFWYLRTLGVQSTKDLTDPDITHVMHYNYSNRLDECPPELLQKAQQLGVPVINDKLLNIKKDYIDKLFTNIFGYSLLVDPTQHYGMVYQTSTQNAIHLHKLIQCPIKESEVDRKPRPSNSGENHYRIYRRWIDTRIDPETIRDFRLLVMGGEVVFLMEKHLDYRCTSHPKKGYRFEVFGYDNLNKFFTSDEQMLIQEFIFDLGADFIELDILRDNSTGLMYIIDANPVPGGGALVQLGDEAIRYLSDIFKQKHLC